MTSRSTSFPQPRQDIDAPVSPARLAAEAFFAAAPIPASVDRTAPQVIVKRRRRLEVDAPDAAPEEGSSLPQDRRPRTHLLPTPAEPAVGGPGAGQADSSPEPTVRPRRRRRAQRALNGAVTIIRPDADGPAVQPGKPDRSMRRPPVAPPPASDQLPRSLRYPRLLAKIRALEQEALQLKQRETTVRWIAQAIRRYDLTASDVGF